MLARAFIILGIAAAAAIELPQYLTKVAPAPVENADAAVQDEPSVQKANASTRPGHARIAADAQGHFKARFKLNGKPVDGLIDTGATLIAFNQSTARRLGFNSASLDFKYPINTANGKTLAAYVKLATIEIGDVRVRDVDAFVMKDQALSGTLVGMSFLKRLSSYTVADGALEMKF
ncbi:TIGR02281 family clan AA aspartic protease [Rhizobium halophytocola]|nr:TIGR02281 family clan AA aspartic protease [Rhizobium halophytocola]